MDRLSWPDRLIIEVVCILENGHHINQTRRRVSLLTETDVLLSTHATTNQGHHLNANLGPSEHLYLISDGSGITTRSLLCVYLM